MWPEVAFGASIDGHLWWWEPGEPGGHVPSLGTRQACGSNQVLAVCPGAQYVTSLLP